jgi:hypothetical protein
MIPRAPEIITLEIEWKWNILHHKNCRRKQGIPLIYSLPFARIRKEFIQQLRPFQKRDVRKVGSYMLPVVRPANIFLCNGTSPTKSLPTYKFFTYYKEIQESLIVYQ